LVVEVQERTNEIREDMTGKSLSGSEVVFMSIYQEGWISVSDRLVSWSSSSRNEEEWRVVEKKVDKRRTWPARCQLPQGAPGLLRREG
jgi:hypothetical protein